MLYFMRSQFKKQVRGRNWNTFEFVVVSAANAIYFKNTYNISREFSSQIQWNMANPSTGIRCINCRSASILKRLPGLIFLALTFA